MRAALAFILAGAALSACSSMPDAPSDEAAWIDEREGSGLSGYPALRDIPEVPDDLRTASEFEGLASDLESHRNDVLTDERANEAAAPRETSADEFAAQARARVRRDVEALDPSGDPARRRD